MFRKILVAINSAVNDRHVFEEALLLAKKTNAQLMLLHVLSPEDQHHSAMPDTFVPYYYPIIADELTDRYRENWQMAERDGLATLQSLAAEATASGITVEFTQNVGNPSQVICQFAKDWQADLILMGRRGRSGLNELFLGSVSNHTLHHAPCSVLVVQGEIKSSSPSHVDEKATIG
ncbi:MAG: universal stress protein [Cyanobacteria bacterium CRU_2_1]|nr:universal stress protein [Cyanobacteria bacterium RU_5_0]NJR58406.1 universal stress protein [Cyanobacteria bacterium CRU_2_1]